MITKLASSYFFGTTDVLSVKSVKGFKSAILTIIAASGDSFYFNAFKTFDETNPSSSNPKVDIYDEGLKQQPRDVSISEAGVYSFILDFEGATNLKVSLSGTYSNSQFALNLRQDKYDNIQGTLYKKAVKVSTGTWYDVSNFSSARIIVTDWDDSSNLNIACTGNIRRTNQTTDTNVTVPLYNGIMQNGMGSDLVADLSNIGSVKFGYSGAIGSSSIYLLLCHEQLPLLPKKVSATNRRLPVNTSNLKSLSVDVNIDGISVGESNVAIDIIDGSNNGVEYTINGVQVRQYTLITSAGTYNLAINCEDLDSIDIRVRRASGYSISILPSFDSLGTPVDSNQISETRYFEYEGLKQVEFELDAIAGDTISILGSNDNFSTSSNIAFIELTQNIVTTTNKILTTGIFKCFANVQDYKKCRILVTKGSQYTFNEALTKVSIVPHKEYIEGLTLPKWGEVKTPFLEGYKWLKIRFNDSMVINGQSVTPELEDCTAFFNLYASTALLYKTWLLDMMTPSNTIRLAKATGGGFVAEMNEPISIISYPRFMAYPELTVEGYKCNLVFEIKCYTIKPDPEPSGMEMLYDKEDYSVFKLPSESVKRDVLHKDILEWTDNSLTFWEGGYLGVKYEIPFGADNVKNYVEGETINFAYLLPFAGITNRSGSVQSIVNTSSRIVVFTNSRIYHNYPKRATDTGSDTRKSDIALFDESSIITDKLWQPVDDKAKVDSKHKYFPILAQYDYDQFDGRIAGTSGFVDTYSNGGLVVPNGKLLLDIPIDGVKYWNRIKYSSMAKGDKWCVYGNYNENPGSEAIAIATNDGGRTWYSKVYFAATDYYNYMYGSKIDLKPITDVAGSYVSESLRMCRRRYNVPTPEVKEPSVPFVVDADDKSLVTGFSVDADGDCLVTLADNVDYDGKYPVVYFENVSANSEWDYICNTGFTADGTTTNSGIFFRVKKVTANTYKLFANLGNPYEGDAVCRHIHAINAVEAGFLVSTGESYAKDWFEGGFIYLITQNNKNGTGKVSPSNPAEVIRLCSSYMGVNRACGAYLFSDHADPTLLYVSDEAFDVSGAPEQTEKRYASINGRTVKVPITPAGIYVGKLSNIDDQSKFDCVCELHTTVVGLLQTHGHFAADGHVNAIMLSKDGFKWEIDVNDTSSINGFDDCGNIYFGNKVAVFK